MQLLLHYKVIQSLTNLRKRLRKRHEKRLNDNRISVHMKKNTAAIPRSWKVIQWRLKNLLQRKNILLTWQQDQYGKSDLVQDLDKCVHVEFLGHLVKLPGLHQRGLSKLSSQNLVSKCQFLEAKGKHNNQDDQNQLQDQSMQHLILSKVNHHHLVNLKISLISKQFKKLRNRNNNQNLQCQKIILLQFKNRSLSQKYRNKLVIQLCKLQLKRQRLKILCLSQLIKSHR